MSVVRFAGSGGGEEGFDFDRVEYTAASLGQHLQYQLHGQTGEEGGLFRVSLWCEENRDGDIGEPPLA